MTRLDYVTIGIIVVCLLALGFLIWRTISARSRTAPETPPTTQENLQDDYNYYQDTAQILPPTDEDLDDNEVAMFDENAMDNTPAPGASKPTSSKMPTITAPRSASSGEYLVLAGSFKIKSNAENEAQRLQKMGYSNASAEIFDRGAYAVVLVDRFENIEDARKLVNELKGKGVEAYVQQRRGE